MKKLLYIFFLTFLFIDQSFAKEQLSKEEKLWLEQKHKVKVRVANWPPFMINKDNNFQGISIEYIKKIFDKYHIQYEFVHSSNYPWKKALSSIKNKDGIDLLPVIKKTSSRAKDMIFTSDYISSPQVIFTRNNFGFISSLDELEGKTIAVEESYVMHDTLKKWYPNINLKVIKGLNLTQTALQELATGKVDAYVGNLTTASYIIKSLQLNNIKVASPTDFPNHNNAMGIRTDWPELVSIINKELKLISNEDKNKIYNKYFSIKYEYGIDKTELFNWIALVTLFFVLIILIIYLKNQKIQAKQELLEEKKDIITEQSRQLQKQNQTLSEHVIYSRTNIEGFFTDVSEAFCRVTGYSRSELIGRHYEIIKHPDMTKTVYDSIKENLKVGKSWQGELKNKKKDGSFIWVYCDIAPEYNTKGEWIGFISIRSDVTVKKDFEKQHIQLLEHAKLASMGEMIGNIAHQWRQPLNAISLSISSINLQYEIGTLTKEEMNKLHDLILNNTSHLSETIDTFRDFIKNEKDYKLLNLQEEINKAVNIAKTSLKDRYISFENKINDEKVLIKTVSGELPQVLINIFNNAQDVLEEKKIEKPWIRLELQEEVDKVIISIEDNAGGIPQKVLPHVFEPYFTTKHKSKGTGLGLHMSYKIVSESLKGEIYVKNTQNGAKFFIELPLEQEDISEL